MEIMGIEVTEEERQEMLTILEKASKLITAKGHCKGTFVDENGSRCTIGAIFPDKRKLLQEEMDNIGLSHGLLFEDIGWNRHMSSLYGTPQWKLEQILEKVLGDQYESVPNWNDLPETTKEDVLNLFATTKSQL